jgi:hypothetical protein
LAAEVKEFGVNLTLVYPGYFRIKKRWIEISIQRF